MWWFKFLIFLLETAHPSTPHPKKEIVTPIPVSEVVTVLLKILTPFPLWQSITDSSIITRYLKNTMYFSKSYYSLIMIFNDLFRRWYYEKNDWIVSDEIEDDEQGKLTYLF